MTKLVTNPERILEALTSAQLDATKAMYELYDNSIAAQANHIWTSSDGNSREFNRLFILDDGVGMSPQELEEALEIGSYSKQKGVSHFGVGMNTALYRLADKATIISKKSGFSLTGAHFDWSEVVAKGTYIGPSDPHQHDYKKILEKCLLDAGQTYEGFTGTLILLEGIKSTKRPARWLKANPDSNDSYSLFRNKNAATRYHSCIDNNSIVFLVKSAPSSPWEEVRSYDPLQRYGGEDYQTLLESTTVGYNIKSQNDICTFDVTATRYVGSKPRGAGYHTHGLFVTVAGVTFIEADKTFLNMIPGDHTVNGLMMEFTFNSMSEFRKIADPSSAKNSATIKSEFVENDSFKNWLMDSPIGDQIRDHRKYREQVRKENSRKKREKDFKNESKKLINILKDPSIYGQLKFFEPLGMSIREIDQVHGKFSPNERKKLSKLDEKGTLYINRAHPEFQKNDSFNSLLVSSLTFAFASEAERKNQKVQPTHLTEFQFRMMNSLSKKTKGA